MKIKVYANTKQFWKEVSPHLIKNEAVNGLGLGLANVFRSHPKDCLYQSALFTESQFLGSLLCSQFREQRNLVPSPVKNLEIATRLFEKFQESNVEVTGVVTEKQTSEFYRGLYHSLGKQTKTLMTQGLYRCRQVKKPTGPAGTKFRVADLRDAAKIGEWIQLFQSEAVPHDPVVNGLEMATGKIDKKMVYVLERNGQLVSMAGWSRDIGTSCSVNLVFTPKEYRNNGYASVVTANLTQALLNSGKKETNLYTDMANPTSNKIYLDLGYEFVCDSVHFGVS